MEQEPNTAVYLQSVKESSRHLILTTAHYDGVTKPTNGSLKPNSSPQWHSWALAERAFPLTINYALIRESTNKKLQSPAVIEAAMK